MTVYWARHFPLTHNASLYYEIEMVARKQKPRVNPAMEGKREIIIVTYYANHATNIRKMHKPDVSQSLSF